MIMLQLLVMGMMFFVIPLLAGTILTKVHHFEFHPVFCWVFGQMLLWAGFLIICVPMVLLGQSFHMVVMLYGVFCSVMAVLGGICFFAECKGGRIFKRQKQDKSSVSKTLLLLWIVFFCLLGFQLVQAVRLTYADWDDAYYVATSTVTMDADSLYRRLAYSGGETTLDLRHGLAPFPIWISFLSKISQIHPAEVSHVWVPFLLLPMTYGVFFLLAKKLFLKGEDKIALFMVFTEILVLFGNYSIYSVENFMLARSRQGKAALGSIMIPALFYLMFLMFQKMQDKKPLAGGFWILIEATLLSTCLCSTMGAMLGCMLLGLSSLCGAFIYKRYKEVVYMGLSLVPSLALLVLYGVLK